MVFADKVCDNFFFNCTSHLKGSYLASRIFNSGLDQQIEQQILDHSYGNHYQGHWGVERFCLAFLFQKLAENSRSEHFNES